MGRCGCATEIVNSTCACAIGESDAISVAGSGNTGDPYIPSLVLNPDEGNTAQVTASGLLVPGLIAATSAERAALTPGAGVRVHLYETDTDLTWVWDGSAWVRAFGTGLLDVQRRTDEYTNTTTTSTVVISTGTIHIPEGLRVIEIIVAWPKGTNTNGVYVMGITRTLPDLTGGTILSRWNGADGAGGSFVAYEEDGVSEGDWKYNFVARSDTTLGGTTTISADTEDPALISAKEL